MAFDRAQFPDLLEEAFAAARLTQLVVSDQIAARPREWAFDRWPGSQLTYLLTCPHCVAVWAAGFGMAAEWLAPDLWRPVRRMLAAALIAGHGLAWLDRLEQG